VTAAVRAVVVEDTPVRRAWLVDALRADGDVVVAGDAPARQAWLVDALRAGRDVVVAGEAV
jgi:DNA-binding NarL/FixJ family response regulator